MVTKRAQPSKVNVNVDPSSVLDLLRDVRFKLPSIADGIAGEVGDAAAQNLRMELIRQGSDVTGTGKASIKSIPRDQGSRAVIGNYYLWIVELGSPPHHPDTSNERFQVWARQHGFTVDELAEIIARKGTRKHPFMDRANRRTTKQTKAKAVKVLKRRL